MQEMIACSTCNGVAKLFTSSHNPQAAEYYCEKCHRSRLANGKEHRTEKKIEEDNLRIKLLEDSITKC